MAVAQDRAKTLSLGGPEITQNPENLESGRAVGRNATAPAFPS
jgi:hypothetical protein